VGGNKLKNQIKVTEQIRTVLKEGKIELYMKEVLIGRVSITLEKQGKLELIQGFTEEDGKIFRLIEHLQDDHPKAYVVGCDLGWC
jgi:hypothetical protein